MAESRVAARNPGRPTRPGRCAGAPRANGAPARDRRASFLAAQVCSRSAGEPELLRRDGHLAHEVARTSARLLGKIFLSDLTVVATSRDRQCLQKRYLLKPAKARSDRLTIFPPVSFAAFLTQAARGRRIGRKARIVVAMESGNRRLRKLARGVRPGGWRGIEGG